MRALRSKAARCGTFRCGCATRRGWWRARRRRARWASQRLQDDDDLLHELLARAPDALRVAGAARRPRMVLRAVQADGLALARAPLLWDDAEIVRAAVEQAAPRS